MSSQVTHAQLSNIHPCARILYRHLSLVISSCIFFTITPTALCNGIPNSLGDKRQERGMAIRKNTGTRAKMTSCTSIIYTCNRDLHYFQSCCAAPTVIHRLLKSTFIPSIQHNLCLPRTRTHLHPPSTLFYPCSIHKFSQRVQTISLLSDPLY